MRVEVIDYEESRTIKRVGDELIPAKRIRHALVLQLPDGSVERAHVTKTVFERFLARH